MRDSQMGQDPRQKRPIEGSPNARESAQETGPRAGRRNGAGYSDIEYQYLDPRARPGEILTR